MRLFHQLVFDGYVNGTSDVFSDNQFDDLLGSADQLSVSGYAAQVTATSGTPNITVQVQNSFDQRRWINRSGTVEVNASTLITTGETNFQGHDGSPTARPTLGFARLRIALGPTAGGPAAQVRVWVTGRDRHEG